MSAGLDPAKRKRMGVTAAVVSAAVAGMVGLSFAAVPLYRAFCQATGYGGTTQRVTAAARRELGRPITVRFDTNASGDLAVEFTPKQRSEQLRLGETGVAFFHIRNLSDKPVTAVASYNVTPYKTAVYFNKLECFCFQPRVYAPGESADLAVVFYVDPALAHDPDTEEVQTLTLSYTYFRSVEEAEKALESNS